MTWSICPPFRPTTLSRLSHSKMTIPVSNPVDSSWVFSLDPSTHPCRCCDAPRAMDHNDGYWHCDIQNRTWVILDSSFDAYAKHTDHQCLGSCCQHPLLDSTVFSMIHAEALDLFWGDLILANETAVLASETSEMRSVREADDLAKELTRQLAIKAADMERYARLKAQTNTEMVKANNGKKIAIIRKIQEPCKWLYLDESAPKHEWRTSRVGKPEPPYRLYLTGAECWAYEYHDPKTGKLQVKHTCDHLHPDEEGWMTEWNKDRRWRPTTASETRDFGCLIDKTAYHKTQPKPTATYHSHTHSGSKKTGYGFRSSGFAHSD